jgi:ABC-type uncharacterized transport system permease subunit
MLERDRQGLIAPAAAAAVAIIVSSIALLISGNNPITAFLEMWKNISNAESIVLIINRRCRTTSRAWPWRSGSR